MRHALTLPTTDARRRPVETMGVRELIAELATLEDELRKLPALVALHGALVANPERRPLVARQAQVVGALRARRTSLRRGGAGRQEGSAVEPA